MDQFTLYPVLIIGISAFSAILILLSDKRPNLREMWSFLAGFAKFFLVISLVPAVMAGNKPYFPLFEIIPGLPCFLRVDALGIIFALVANGLWIVTSLFSVGYMRLLKEHQQTRYYFCFAISLSATTGIAFAGDLITLFIFYEILTMSTYWLVVHKETKQAIRAGRKYLAYSLFGGAMLLMAIILTKHELNQIAFVPGGFISQIKDAKLIAIIFAFFIAGFGVKAALFPLHSWLPSAMVAPTPVSALLHAVAVVKAGVFGILRVTGYVFGPSCLEQTGLWQWLALIAALTILFGSFISLAQDNLKKRLAYSTISQLSYIILGAALLSKSAFLGSIMHLANHGFMKITLFFCAGAIYAKLHKENIKDMNGIGRVMPVTMAAFSIGVLGLCGMPLTCKFISKLFLIRGAIEAEQPFFVLIYLFSAFMNAAYFFPIIIRAFFEPWEGGNKTQKKGYALIAAPICTAILGIVFGTVIPFVHFKIRIAQIAVKEVMGGLP